MPFPLCLRSDPARTRRRRAVRMRSADVVSSRAEAEPLSPLLRTGGRSPAASDAERQLLFVFGPPTRLRPEVRPPRVHLALSCRAEESLPAVCSPYRTADLCSSPARPSARPHTQSRCSAARTEFVVQPPPESSQRSTPPCSLLQVHSERVRRHGYCFPRPATLSPGRGCSRRHPDPALVCRRFLLVQPHLAQTAQDRPPAPETFPLGHLRESGRRDRSRRTRQRRPEPPRRQVGAPE